MNRNQLRYFVSAAEHRSFTKAAEQYYISQTAVTQQIQQLEQTLGCELFDRSTRPVSLTSAGKSFLLDAKAILERMSRAQERVHDAATGLTGTLRVGYVRGYERSDLSVLMRHFHQKNSNVLITFYRCSTDVLAAGLLHQEYDIVFTWDSTNLRTQEGVTFQTVEKARLVVALYAGHPLTQRRQLTRQELRGENILYMSPDAAPDSYGDAFFMQRYAEAGYKPNILFRSADTESILMMVAAEEGISLLPDYCTDRLYNADNLVFVPLVGEGEEEEIIAAWQSGNQNPALGRFLTELNQKDPPFWRKIASSAGKYFFTGIGRPSALRKQWTDVAVAAKAFEELRILFFAGEVLAEITFHFIENGAGRRVNRQNRTVFIKRSLIYHEEGVDASRFICYAYQ